MLSLKRIGVGLAFATLVGTAACDGPGEKVVRAPAISVAEGHPLADQLWPALLQHCRRNPSCDPMSTFGAGIGEASGISGFSSWFAERADVLSDGEVFGDRIRVSLYAYRGEGGAAGRPVRVSEREGNLRAYRDGLSRLTIEYRRTAGVLVPYFASVRTQQVVFDVPGVAQLNERSEVLAATAAYVENWVWSDGGQGAEIELSIGGRTVFVGRSTGGGSRTVFADEEVETIPLEPWTFVVQEELAGRHENALIDALSGDGFVRLMVRAPDGGVVLEDSFAVGGHVDALAEAEQALADPKIDLALTERCARFVGWDNDDWAGAEGLSPAEESCDPLTDLSRRRILDQQPSGSPM